MHVTRLKANLNSPNGQPYEFDLGLHTLVVGDNEAGKSSCVSTPLRLALTGTTDDVAGRDDVRDPQLLAQHAPVDGTCTLAALATFDEGSEASWGAVVESDGTVKRPMHDAPNAVDPSSVLPLRSIREVLKGDAKSARRTFLQWVGQTTSQEDVMAAIPGHLHARYSDVAEKQQGSSTDRLVAVAEYAAKRVRDIEADAKGQDALLSGVESGVQAAPSAAEVEQAREHVRQWTAALERASAWEARAPVADAPALQAELAELGRSVEEAQAAVQAWEAQVEQVGPQPQAPASGDERLETLADLLDDAAPSGVCPVYLDVKGEQNLAAWAAYHRGRSRISPEAAQAYQQTAQEWSARRQPAVEAREGWKAVLTQRRLARGLLEGRLAGLMSMQASTSLPVDPGVTVVGAREGLEAARARLGGLEKLVASWETIRGARDRAAALRSEKPAYEDLRDRCNEAVRDLLSQQRASFQERVQKYLPDRWKFEIQLQDGGKEVFRVGYRREDGRLHTPLSGAALDALEVALCMAVWELGGGGKKGKKGKVDGKYALVIPRDRQRTPEVLRDLLKAWSSFPGQVVVETTIMPQRGVPAGWKLLDLNAWRRGLEVVEKPEKVEAPWCYDPTADTYLRVSEVDRAKQDALSLAHLVEIEGLDEEAPARHRAAMLARRGNLDVNLAPGNGGTATTQAGNRGGNLPPPPGPALSPPPPPAQVEQVEQVEQPLPPPPAEEEEVYDRPALAPAVVESTLRTLGYLPEKVEKMGPKLRRLVATEGVPPECTMTLGNSFVIYGVDNKPARSLPLGE